MSTASEALPLPDVPSIAVLPFTNMSGDPEQEYFSDGIADDITTELSRDHALFVIARSSSFTYRGRSIDVRRVGRELGVRYVVEGSVRRDAKDARVTVQLVDATTGNHIWAERYDREVDRVLALQSEIAESVVAAILQAVGDAERHNVIKRAPNNLSAWEMYQRGAWHFYKQTPADNEQSRAFFGKAIEIDPTFLSPHIGLANTYLWDHLYYGSRDAAETAMLVEEEARKALAIDRNDAAAQRELASAFLLAGNHREAFEGANRALALNRNSTGAYRLRAVTSVLTGQYEEGRIDALTSLRLSPRDPLSGVGASYIALSYYLQRDYEMTVEVAKGCLVKYPQLAPHRYLAAALGQLGRRSEAANTIRVLLTGEKSKVDAFFRNRPAHLRPEDYEHILDGLRKAGWQG
jgi:adenylate cyclase